jgi:hypothetical protein
VVALVRAEGHDATLSEKPVWGVKLGLGVVTYWNDEPIVTRERAEEARAAIERSTGESGEVAYIFVSLGDHHVEWRLPI